MEPIILGVAIAVGIISTLSMFFSINALIKLNAFERSTHQIQYVPVDESFEKESEEQMKDINKKFKEYVEEDFSDIINDQAV